MHVEGPKQPVLACVDLWWDPVRTGLERHVSFVVGWHLESVSLLILAELGVALKGYHRLRIRANHDLTFSTQPEFIPMNTSDFTPFIDDSSAVAALVGEDEVVFT